MKSAPLDVESMKRGHLEIELLGEHIATQAAHLDAATHRLLTDIRTFDQAGGWFRQGARSCAAWLSWRIGWDGRTARDRVRVANRLGELPLVDDALRRAELSYSKVRAITRVANAEIEATLVEYARYTTGAQLEKICRMFASVVKHDSDVKPSDDLQRRTLRWRDLDDGMVMLQAVLHPEEAALLKEAIERIATERCRDLTHSTASPPQHASSASSRPSDRGGSAEPAEVDGTMGLVQMPGRTMRGGAMPGSTMPEGAMPESTMPESTMPESTMPGSTMPGSTMPEATMPGSTMPGNTMPGNTMPGSIPERTIPGSTMSSIGALRCMRGRRRCVGFAGASIALETTSLVQRAQSGSAEPPRYVLPVTDEGGRLDGSIQGDVELQGPPGRGSAEPRSGSDLDTEDPDIHCDDLDDVDDSSEVPRNSLWGSAEPLRRNFAAEQAGRDRGRALRDAATQRSFDRAGALVAMAEQVVRGVATQRSPINLVVTSTLDTLLGRRETRSSTQPTDVGVVDGLCISATAVRRLACDCSVTQVLEDENGNALSVGRKTRKIPGAMKAALLRADQKCRFPGCNARAFLEGHHAVHWVDGGPTEIPNLLCLCGWHHRFVHEYGFEISMDADRVVTVTDPRGRRIIEAPPRHIGPVAGLPMIEAANANLGITAETMAYGWNGEPIDYPACVDGLLAPERKRLRLAAARD